ncbi:MAG: type II toxin-antitoxin system HicB family antitoxin [Candidatus Yonathbacteria bacterium]|nr:type II toxin-antitoxin system HicB family antitoxin [Candidatus Yonathbacteria bacterium]
MKKGIYITLDIEKLPEGYYVATSRDVQGLVAQAKTFEKTIEIAEDIARTLFHAQKGKIKQREIITYPMMIPA